MQNHEVLCGNLKLMEYYEILNSYPEIITNIKSLEEEGKTVVILAMNKVP
jgi:cation transport ATPase